MKIEVINVEGNKHKEAYMNLMDYVYNPSACDYFESEWDFLTPDNGTILAVFDEDGTMSNTASIINKEMYLNGHLVKMGGIACVGSLGTARGGGVVREIIRECLNQMNEQGMVFSLLGPFKYEFYEKFGYKLCFEKYECSVPMAELRIFKNNRKHILVNGENVERLKDFYHEHCSKWNGCCMRTSRDLYRTLDRGDKWRAVMIENDEGKIEGYMIFKLSHDEGAFRIREFNAISTEAVHSLFKFAYLHEAQFDKMILFTYPKDQIMDYLINPSVDWSIETGMMGRIVNVNKALATYPFIGTGNMIIKVEDETCEWNHQVFEIIVEDGTVLETKKTDKTPQLTIHIKELSQLVLGYRTLSDLIRINKVDILDSSVKQYFQCLRQSVALYDFF